MEVDQPVEESRKRRELGELPVESNEAIDAPSFKKAKLDESSAPTSSTQVEAPSQSADMIVVTAEPDATPSQPTNSENRLVSLRNGRVVFPEKRMNLRHDPSTVRDLANFHAWLSDNAPHIDDIPQMFLPLVGRLVQDCDGALHLIVKDVNELLCPTSYDDNSDPVLSIEVTKKAIQASAARINYGYRVDKDIANLAIWRWEMNEIDSLPAAMKDAILERRKKREQAREELKQIVERSTEEERNVLLASKRSRASKKITDTANKENTTEESSTPKTKKPTVAKQTTDNNTPSKTPKAPKAPKAEKTPKAPKAEKTPRAPKTPKVEKTPKEKPEVTDLTQDAPEGEEGKAAEKKEVKKVELKKKAEAGLRKINSFFKLTERKREPSTGPVLSVFDEIFKPFSKKQGTTLAAYNSSFRVLDVNLFDVMIAAQDVDVRADCLPFFTSKKAKTGLEKWKFMHFDENHRPAYYGTWFKTSKTINGRRPFAKDDTVLEYDYDSEEEWEEEEPGEELNSEDEMDEDDEDGSEEEVEGQDWMVPHGYLSDDEGIDIENRTTTKDKEPERKLNMFEAGQTVVLGPIFRESFTVQPDDALENYRIQFLYDLFATSVDPFEVVVVNKPSDKQDDKDAEKKAAAKAKQFVFTDEVLAELVAAVQGTSIGIQKHVEDMKTKYPLAPKSQIEAMIKKLMVKEKRNSDTKPTWYVMSTDVAPQQENVVPMDTS